MCGSRLEADVPLNDETNIPKILVVEDDPDQRQLLCEMLSMRYDDPDGRFITGAAG